MISGLFGGVAAIIAWQIYQYFKEKREEEAVEESIADSGSEPEAASASDQRPLNKDLVLASLRELQCEPVISNETETDCSIDFEYQAEQFRITIDESCRYVTLYDAFWYSFDANDIEQLGAVKRIVNDINWQSQVNVCYNKTDENNMFNVHIQASFICTPFSDYTGYLRHILRECFVVHNHFFKLLAEANLTNENNR